MFHPGLTWAPTVYSCPHCGPGSANIPEDDAWEKIFAENLLGIIHQTDVIKILWGSQFGWVKTGKHFENKHVIMNAMY